MKTMLTISDLIESAKLFCEVESDKIILNLWGLQTEKLLERMWSIDFDIFFNLGILLKLEVVQRELICPELKFRQI